MSANGPPTPQMSMLEESRADAMSCRARAMNFCASCRIPMTCVSVCVSKALQACQGLLTCTIPPLSLSILLP